ncbi:hypothetical protein QJS04_geneDACA016543 [Acorus gramineus]|uniref:Uncharacterized protein n=1 Tax=Acorus gramineus TaxID=55184 RepID=A0AAV9BC74_ACOGR|nr:hypothetical protein QJS04_geneDACA016543 [Acorus gramineus]
MLVHEMGRKDREKERGVKGKYSANSGATPSVANFDEGDDDEEMGELNVEHELSDHRGVISSIALKKSLGFPNTKLKFQVTDHTMEARGARAGDPNLSSTPQVVASIRESSATNSRRQKRLEDVFEPLEMAQLDYDNHHHHSPIHNDRPSQERQGRYD